MTTKTNTTAAIDLADIVARIGLANTDHVVASLRLVGELRGDLSVRALTDAAKEAGLSSPTTCARGWTLLATVAHLADSVRDEDGDPVGLPSWERIVRAAGTVYNDKQIKAKFEAEPYADLSDMIGALLDREKEAQAASKDRLAAGAAAVAAAKAAPADTPAPDKAAPGTRTLAAMAGDVTADLARLLARIEAGEEVDTVTLAAINTLHKTARAVAEATLAARATLAS